MGKNYKLIITNKHIYREAELSVETGEIKIGNTPRCEVRLNKELFFTSFELTAFYKENKWYISCSDSAYISPDDVRKLRIKELVHGDRLKIKYQSGEGDALEIGFSIDFDYENKNYERIIDISSQNQVNIGGMVSCNIVLSGSYTDQDLVELTHSRKGLEMFVRKSAYGVYRNGALVQAPAQIEEHDFISIADYSFYYKNKKLYTSKYADIVLNGLGYKDIRQQNNALKYPKFNRNTRIKEKIATELISILDPPAKTEKPKSNLAMSLMPAVGMLAMTVFLRGMMSGSNSSFIIFSACSVGLGIITSIVSFIDSGREYRKNSKERVKKYLAYVDHKRMEIDQFRKAELLLLENIYYSLDQDTKLVKDFSGELFNRTPDDEDFLHIYLGKGARKAARKVDFKKQEKFDCEDNLATLPERVAEEYKNIYDAPIVSRFNESNAVGVIGEREHLYTLLKNMTLDLCVRHYYREVKLFYFISEEQVKQFSWVRLLMHIQNDDFVRRNIAYDDNSKTLLFEYLYNEFVRRDENKKERYTHWVIFVFDEMGFRTHPISKFVEKAKDLKITFVFFETAKEYLPVGCNEIIVLDEAQAGTLIYSADQGEAQTFHYPVVEDSIAGEIAMKLAPVYCEEVSLESTLTKSISLFELLHIYALDEDLDLASNWSQSRVDKSMAAPLGVRTKDEIVYLDLHEKAHGPHGLVAGTTGSGKSEILQSYILSMAVLFHPYEVSFVIIDFKGGGMVTQFEKLPHLNGAITDIDGREINRSLLSIKAELDKRKAAFAENKVNHIDKYIEKFKSGEVQKPLPHLILIVDEFAELKQDQPEFMNELISAARIGRSLGVHLILATQKPSGVVSEQIWSNSKFKLCLKVQDASDSNQVIKSPLAAEIKEPGRAYLQVGNNEIFELFQSAYSGAPAEHSDDADQREFTISEVSLCGDRTPVFVKKRRKTEKKKTELEALVEAVHDFCEKRNIKKLPGICLPSLPSVLHYHCDNRKLHPVECIIPIGVYDDPSRQFQGDTYMNLSQDNVFIVGSSLSGKTTLLQTMIRSLTQIYSPKEVNIYILDFASKILKNFSGLHHVGGVVTDSDYEMLKSFIKMLGTEIILRKNTLSELKLSSFISYREAGYTDLPQIVVFIDNFTALKDFEPEYEDELLNFMREGISVGISIVITNLQTSGFSYRYLTNFSKRIAFYCNDSGQYGSLFDRCRMEPANVSGRALTEIDRTLYEFQTYLSFEGTIEKERVDEMEKYIAQINMLHAGEQAKGIPVVPKVLDMKFVQSMYGKSGLPSYHVPVALDYGTVELATVNLSKESTFAILGREKSGRTNLVKVILSYLTANVAHMPTDVYLIDDFDNQLKPFEKYDVVKQYTMLSSDFGTIINEIHQELSNRYDAVVKGGAAALQKLPLLLVLVQNNDAIAQVSGDKKTLDLYKNILNRYKALKVSFIYTNIENTNPAFSSPEILRDLKNTRNAIFFDDLKNIKMFDGISMNTMRTFKNPIQLGDAYLIREGDVKKVKTIHLDGETNDVFNLRL